MVFLTNELADTLCTIIAVGFISKNPRANYVYEDPRDEEKHLNLKHLLHAHRVEVNFQQASSQSVQPFIFAQNPYLYSKEVLQGMADDFMTSTQYVQVLFNAQKLKRPMPGAYIGSRMDLNSILIDSPSALYQYQPRYRNADDPAIQASYQKAKIVNNDLIGFLQNVPPFEAKGRRILPDRDRLAACIAQFPYQPNHLFASCHGMILAIYDYSYYLTKESVCVELALGDDTRKVASCLPCSLFMAANGCPASAIHLGRGDNWYYPLEKAVDHRTQVWKDAVKLFFQQGLLRLPMAEGNKIHAFTSYLVNPDRSRFGSDPANEIPDIFLESLTYEDSFINKMIRTLTPAQ